ncbi:UV-stimulated scaffold protein A-like protein [Hibiscus syriacus]|uniref:UV-stimulated scaffold protein A-like protein n=1 Tax=Hibiscus syriacus TaxID=106335 RepID=A0A6A3AW44_HIBSY|nr:UV-stimulated scaffold protein A homolog [Hibiscus syriacus]XP_039057283.1 UV-stimulated scaffold protein A homolog [Hibiscus syriacus]KAE8708013.1 UV-stimulated scaffold protein A-like protein [Hibiscus syriacus]KAE8726816.1 UV-stimulated scaffold protein A-like protein [Hibiscus syriacus]
MAMEMEERGKVGTLIEKATNSTASEVDPRFLKAIKSVVRSSDKELRLAAHTLMDLMKRDHSQVRYLTLLIIDELFMRSKLFRTLVVEKLDQLLALSVGFRRNMPLPAPSAIASTLRSKAIEFLEKWNASFGIHYRQLRLGFDYLKNTLRFQFPNLQETEARIERERRERERRTREILQNKFETLKTNFSSVKEEIRATVDEIRQCLDIVRTKEECVPPILLDDEDFVEFRSAELRQIRLDSLKEGEKVHENNDNKVVFDALRELYKLLVTKHLVSVQESISILIRVEVADNRSRDSMLKELIDIRNSLMSVKKDCEESGCALPKTAKNKEEEEEDFWEEGDFGSTNNGATTEPEKRKEVESSNADEKSRSVEDRNSKKSNNRSENLAKLPASSKVKAKDKERGNLSSKGKEILGPENSVWSDLLAEAPVLNWGSFLDNWGSVSNRDTLANQKGLELDNHWGRVDYDAVIPAEKIAELNLQATIYLEKLGEIQPCRAPLNKGGLCQRRDLKICPFHGPIISRDDAGNPINQNSSTDNTDPDLGSGLAEQLAKKAVNNVRERDKEEARKRKLAKQSLKREKLAKVREHNEVVLRDAAMASTSISAAFGEDMEETIGERSVGRRNKQTLASMLRKKVTTKDRLAQRLLNTRAIDATIRQMTQGEDATYKEAFPNQW